MLRKAVQAERQPYSGALLQHLEAQPIQHIGLIRQYRGAGIDLLYVRKGVPWMRPEDHAHMLEGLRKAGWEG